MPDPTRTLAMMLAATGNLARLGIVLSLCIGWATTQAIAQPTATPCSAPESGYVGEESRNLRSVIVFVHGLGGSATGTWTYSPMLAGDDVFWPCLLRQDPEFAESNVYVYQYGSQIMSETATIGSTASDLYRDLTADRVFHHPHLIALLDQAECGLQHADMRFTANDEPVTEAIF